MAEGDKVISKYNEATLQIERLHNSWVLANNYLTKGNLPQWDMQLNAIWGELYADIMNRLSEKEREIVLTRNNILQSVISQQRGGGKYYHVLYMRHLFLKEIQDMVGKGGAYGDEDEEGWE